MRKIFILVAILAPLFVLAQNDTINTIAGIGYSPTPYAGDGGLATLAHLAQPVNMFVDNNGNVFIADRDNNVIRKVNTLGIISTVAGYGLSGYSGDGGPATSAQLSTPTAVITDNAGNMYIADANNHRIRKVDASGIITTFAGTGANGYSGDGGPADSAEMAFPNDLALDDTGNIYFVDWNNNRIRKVNTVGIITTVAGNGQAGYSGDGGPATSARLNFAYGGLGIDSHNNIYLADASNNRIRKVNTLGIITTIAGYGIYPGFNGDNISADTAQLWGPIDVAVDHADNIYISEYSGQRIRKINTANIINTIAGDGYAAGTNGGAFVGDGGPSIDAEFHLPNGICLDNAGNIYVADEDNYRIRKIGTAPILPASVPSANLSTTIIYPNPTNDFLHIDNIATQSYYYLYNVVGSIVSRGSLKQGSDHISMQTLSPGIYTLMTYSNDGQKTFAKIVKQ